MKKNFQMRVVQVFDCDTREEAEYVARTAKASLLEFRAKHPGMQIGDMRCELIKAPPKAFDSETVEGQPSSGSTLRGFGAVIAESVPLSPPKRSVILNIPGCDGDGMTAEAKGKLS